MKPDAKQNLNANIFGNHDHGGLGFVLQQDGANTNRFTASLGVGANQWVLARSVQLVAGRWQHVALVKTPDRLTFFFNGVAVAPDPRPRRWPVRRRHCASGLALEDWSAASAAVLMSSGCGIRRLPSSTLSYHRRKS